MIHKKNGPAAMVRDGDPGSWSTRNASAHGAGSDLARHALELTAVAGKGAGMRNAANLQMAVKTAKTAKEVAKLYGISERQLFKAAVVMRVRPDLADKVQAGEMSVHAAWLEATGRSKPTSWDRLVTAWNNATTEDRVRLLEQVGSYDLAEIKSRTPICLPDRSATANLQNGGA